MSNIKDVYSLNTIFTIVVCGEVFNISWKSLVSDGPTNFFTRHFIKSKSRIIHIDRSPETFKYIIRHLRGYPVIANNEILHQDLINDGQYYGLKKLLFLLKQFVYLNIGGTSFRLRWDLFDKDGPHNYFTGPLKHALLSPHPTLGESAPISIERDPEIFKDIIRHLQGYSIHIKDEQHRLQLLSDAQFYLFKKLRDKLKSSSTHVEKSQTEILLKYQDIKSNQIEIINDIVYYKQDEHKSPFLLTIQIDDFNISCHLSQDNTLFFLLDRDIFLQHYKLQNQVEFDKDCAIICQEEFSLSDYLLEIKKCVTEWKPCQLHSECQIYRMGIEKAIAKINSNQEELLSISLQKILVIKSRIQANMKRDFL